MWNLKWSVRACKDLKVQPEAVLAAFSFSASIFEQGVDTVRDRRHVA
jgi:hypothetical protein